jgi:transcriptional regulator with XRE-family HTH domain
MKLATRVGLSPSNLKRIEEGGYYRMETKRKILEALGIGLEKQKSIFQKN